MEDIFNSILPNAIYHIVLKMKLKLLMEDTHQLPYVKIHVRYMAI